MPNPIMEYFEWGHLPPHLAGISAPMGSVAKAMDETLPDSAEKSAGLRKLLEAKDCFVRCAVTAVAAEKARAEAALTDEQRADRDNPDGPTAA